jgi:putative lipoprotein
MQKSRIIIGLLIVSSFFFQVCTGSKSSKNKKMKSINVSVTYRERIILPPGAELKLTLADAAKMDVAAEEIASLIVPLEGGPPYDLKLDYDPGKLNKNGRYVLRAAIRKDDKLMFTSTESIEAFKNQEGVPVEIMLRSLDRKSASFTQGNIPLEETYWKLISLNDKDVKVGDGDQDLYIQFLHDEKRVSGYAGCNNYSGGYETEGLNLKFGMMMSTKKMCVETIDQEQEYLLMLSKTESYSIEEDKLIFRNSEGQVLAEFKAGQKKE